MSLATSLKKILVVGGNGFIGSAVCRAAVAKGLEVTSVSSSGNPYRTPKGHSPSWTSKVNWHKGDALNPQSFAHLFEGVGGVVHTLGTLLEDGAYKRAIREGNVPALVKSFLGTGQDSNPLRRNVAEEQQGSYERINRDSALRVCESFLESSKTASNVPNQPRPFVYVSAEDIFRPIVPARYIETKREAEQRIEEMMRENPDYRGVYIRPSLVYHAHLRPLTTPIATVLDVSAAVHRKLPRGFPAPSSILRSLGSVFPQSSSSLEEASPLDSIANALTLPPIHVDQVAAAIMATLDSSRDVRGVVGVLRMRELIGWGSDKNVTVKPSVAC
ncbi:mitochondrial protein [Coprinopsis cinerea okayama7|uniref:Mitochondrial protein n=1 Tax=Coprinopsis cinerea (strain Okayama-7 / 130 / ATCC MYA-4618 / FGSC 9003) TaxID=240176 RepID=A8NF81_COPC7|nr:mitochondrial protein [Coprinopsis cinerea okayama7\|eukprot:XP_001833220.2 mitochondrial protein [Coprinopsis cinerea okayama7\